MSEQGASGGRCWAAGAQNGVSGRAREVARRGCEVNRIIAFRTTELTAAGECGEFIGRRIGLHAALRQRREPRLRRGSRLQPVHLTTIEKIHV